MSTKKEFVIKKKMKQKCAMVRFRERLMILRKEDIFYCKMHAKLFAIRSLLKC